MFGHNVIFLQSILAMLTGVRVRKDNKTSSEQKNLLLEQIKNKSKTNQLFGVASCEPLAAVRHPFNELCFLFVRLRNPKQEKYLFGYLLLLFKISGMNLGAQIITMLGLTWRNPQLPKVTL